MNTEITTFEINRGERNKLLYDRNRHSCTFMVATCISTLIGFLLNLIGVIAKPQNANLRLFLESAILPSTVIAGVFFIIAIVQLATCWIPKADKEVTLRFDSFTKTIEISTGGKSKKFKLRSVIVIPSENLIILRGLIKRAIIPLSCINSDKLMLLLTDGKK